MATISHRDMKPEDCITGLRKADEAECLAAGLSSEQALAISLRSSVQAFAVEADGIPVAFWGWSGGGYLSDIAYGWLLTTPAIEAYKFRFIRSSQRIVEWLLSVYPKVIVVVHEDHLESIKWLKWLGFKDLYIAEFIYMIKER